MTRELPLTRGRVALVDDVDYERVRGWSWIAVRADDKWYARHNEGRGAYVLLGRYLLDAEPGDVVGYINGDGLDNRRANIRLCTRAESRAKSAAHKSNRSGARGVQRARGRFRARITIDGVDRNLGTFATAAEASAAYRAASVAYYGELAGPQP